MGWYNHKKNVDKYIRMASGCDGRELIKLFRKYLAEGSSILEIGMGPGTDLQMLEKYFKVTGSDNSIIFLDLYSQIHPKTDLLLLDAVSLKTERKFNGIYSNKVLYHLSKNELKKSLTRQKEVLMADGILLHSFWKGKGEEKVSGLKFVYYTKGELIKIIGNEFDILYINEYREMKNNDSLVVIMKKQPIH